MPRKTRDLTKSLTQKFGFARPEHGDRHKWLALSVEGAAMVSVMFSHNDPELGDKLLSKIARQLRVSRPYLDGMIDCTNSCAAYCQKLVDEA